MAWNRQVTLHQKKFGICYFNWFIFPFYICHIFPFIFIFNLVSISVLFLNTCRFFSLLEAHVAPVLFVSCTSGFFHSLSSLFLNILPYGEVLFFFTLFGGIVCIPFFFACANVFLALYELLLPFLGPFLSFCAFFRTFLYAFLLLEKFFELR